MKIAFNFDEIVSIKNFRSLCLKTDNNYLATLAVRFKIYSLIAETTLEDKIGKEDAQSLVKIIHKAEAAAILEKVKENTKKMQQTYDNTFNNPFEQMFDDLMKGGLK